MPKRQRNLYIETKDGDSWTGQWLRQNLEKNSVPTSVQGQPVPKHLWHVTTAEFRMVERHRYREGLKYHVYSALEGNKPHRDYKLEKSRKQRDADTVGREITKFKKVKSSIGRGLLALAE